MNYEIKKDTDGCYWTADLTNTVDDYYSTDFEVELWHQLEFIEGRCAYYRGEFEFYSLECEKADTRIEMLTKELKNLADKVDDALLLDEELHEAWNDLHKGVEGARKVLGEVI